MFWVSGVNGVSAVFQWNENCIGLEQVKKNGKADAAFSLVVTDSAFWGGILSTGEQGGRRYQRKGYGYDIDKGRFTGDLRFADTDRIFNTCK